MQRIRFRTTRRLGAAFAVAAVACVTSPLPRAAPASGGTSVTCRVQDDARGRVFRMRRGETRTAPGGSVWTLSMRETASGDAWIALALPGAKPLVAPPTATLSYRNANGGRHVDLSVSPSASRLEVWVDHGLEVNIEPDLDPRVDRLNTDGPLTRLDCVIE